MDTPKPDPTRQLDVLLLKMPTTVANQVVHWFDSTRGYPGGSYVEQLIKLITLADADNRWMISQVYPFYAYAVTAAKDVEGGLERLAEIASNAEG